MEDDDGPMLELLKGFHGADILLPSRSSWRPDRDLLSARFERFLGAT